MAKGKPSKCLSADLLERLEEYRQTERLSIPRLCVAMAAPFGWEVLSRALAGRPVWDLNHSYIVAWIDGHLKPSTKAEQRAEDYGAIGVKSKNGGK